ncbi:Acyl-CoA N-acyltransferase [Penicillium macrosclerotiorum]|uniref:Acyl-CoA N-acyltransferase n=1 Tax=Penicillium macrosclerotiorum TaxID=303699 RepID=UPI002547CCB0|nr:Acyl-CoA N-acyltransferase [Penicillium macrosclerotiorum]KAJ5679333.1 Acyl-CoA N-acyltransferase [Penicillium macrosclerotiorum]
MAPFEISQCSVVDGAALAANSIPAFWADPNWVLAWRHRTLEYHISQIALRFPRNLLNNREALRHQKAVDLETGRILGYARWRLPSSYETNPDDSTPTWPEAQVPAVEPETETEIRRIAETVVWDPNGDDNELSDRVDALKKEVTPKTPYISLEYLAVHPDNQRKGVGTALVKSGMYQADKMKLRIFVHALREGAELYKRIGFQLIAELIQDDSAYGGSGEYGAYFFIYEPGSRASSA